MMLMCIDNKHQIYENGEHPKMKIGKEYEIRYWHKNEYTQLGFTLLL
jgi:hypothetical protein